MAFLLLVIALCSGVRTASCVCYGDLGCFENAPPFDNAGKEVPSSPDQVGTRFLLYTRATKNGPAKELSYTDTSVVRTSGFAANLPVKLIVHGFGQSENSDWLNSIKNALLDSLDCNVIIVGWANGAASPVYNKAAANARLVGRQIAALVQLLVDNGSSLQKVHIIGHSLGAHTAGYAGSELKGGLQRISGLDPAGPNFEGKDARVRLDPSDAVFVDVIHSNGAPLLQGGAGIAAACGHVDFYPNGGVAQPGCPPVLKASLSAILKGDIQGALQAASCSHARAYDLFIASIAPTQCTFKAYSCAGGYSTYKTGKCSSCTAGCPEMGYNADKSSARGSFYLTTSAATPFCSIQPIVGY